jgi:hypothetical protein
LDNFKAAGALGSNYYTATVIAGVQQIAVYFDEIVISTLWTVSHLPLNSWGAWCHLRKSLRNRYLFAAWLSLVATSLIRTQGMTPAFTNPETTRCHQAHPYI